MKASKLTKEQHKAYGAALKIATDIIVEMQANLGPIYGRDGRETRLAEKANTALLHLRSQLEVRAIDENPTDRAAERYYFGETKSLAEAALATVVTVEAPLLDSDVANSTVAG